MSQAQDMELFSSEENAKKTFEIIEDFVQSYIENKEKMPLKVWLTQKLTQSGVWGDEVEKVANLLIDQAQKRADIREAYDKHIKEGKNEETFIASYVEQKAKELGISNEEAAKQIDDLAVSFDKRLETQNEDGWNDFTRIENAELISGKAHAMAMIGMIRQAKDDVVNRVKNMFSGKKNPTFQESLEKIIINASATASDNVGLNVAIGAGFMTAAKSGFVKFMDRLAEHTSDIWGVKHLTAAASAVTHAGALAIDTARVAYDLATGKMDIEQVISAIRASSTAQNLGSLGGGAFGAMAGTILGPIGVVVGGAIGAYVGKKTADLLEGGVDRIKKIVGEETVERVTTFAKQAVKTGVEFVKSVAGGTWGWLKKKAYQALA